MSNIDKTNNPIDLKNINDSLILNENILYDYKKREISYLSPELSVINGDFSANSLVYDGNIVTSENNMIKYEKVNINDIKEETINEYEQIYESNIKNDIKYIENTKNYQVKNYKDNENEDNEYINNKKDSKNINNICIEDTNISDNTVGYNNSNINDDNFNQKNIDKTIDFFKNNFCINNNFKDKENSFIVENIDIKTNMSNENSLIMKNELENVYISMILNLFLNINKKIDSILKNNDNDKKIIEECYKKMICNEYEDVINLLKLNVNGINKIEIEKEKEILYLKKEFPVILFNVKQEILNIKEIILKIKNKLKEIILKYNFEKNNNKTNIKRLKNEKKELEKICTVLTTEKNNMKDNLIEILEKYGSSENLESKLEVDLFENINFILISKITEIKKLKEEIEKISEIIKKKEIICNENKIKKLESDNNQLKLIINKIRNENINLTKEINKLSEKNITDKKTLILFNDELKKIKEILKSKNYIIERQKKLLYLLQNKLGLSNDITIEDLKRKKNEIEIKIKNEKDFIQKKKFEKELEDVNKRLIDFLNLNNKKY